MVASQAVDLSLLRWRSMTRELAIVALRRAAFCLGIHEAEGCYITAGITAGWYWKSRRFWMMMMMMMGIQSNGDHGTQGEVMTQINTNHEHMINPDKPWETRFPPRVLINTHSAAVLLSQKETVMQVETAMQWIHIPAPFPSRSSRRTPKGIPTQAQSHQCPISVSSTFLTFSHVFSPCPAGMPTDCYCKS